VGGRCYLDANATMLLPDEVIAVVTEVLRAGLGNPASPHTEGRRARALIEQARSEVAALLGAAAEEVVFTSGGTEGNAAGLWGLVAGEGPTAGRTLVVSAVEHPAVRTMADQLACHGVAVVAVPVRSCGVVDLDALGAALAQHRGATLAVQLANSETGVEQPVREIAAMAAETGASLHCDAVQAAGKVPLESDDWGVATLAVAGHKFGAPSGVGALVVRRARFAPLIPGSQERQRRGGTENLPGIVGMGVAARLARERLGKWRAVGLLRDRLESEVLARIPGVVVYGAGAARLANTSCLGLPHGPKGGAIVAALDLEGYAVSAGPACTSGVERSSPTVKAMGFCRGASERTLRVSLGLGTDEGNVLGLVAALERVLLRSKEGWS
jgi:cysteine desulfurase